MPGLNRKGPAGEGSMTGRKMGRCTQFGEKLIDKNGQAESTQDSNEKNSGRGFGFGRRGQGRGMGPHNRMRGGGQPS